MSRVERVVQAARRLASLLIEGGRGTRDSSRRTSTLVLPEQNAAFRRRHNRRQTSGSHWNAWPLRAAQGQTAKERQTEARSDAGLKQRLASLGGHAAEDVPEPQRAISPPLHRAKKNVRFRQMGETSTISSPASALAGSEGPLTVAWCGFWTGGNRLVATWGVTRGQRTYQEFIIWRQVWTLPFHSWGGQQTRR